MSECTKNEEKQERLPQDCCPVDMAIEKWSKAFCQAKHEAMVEILKTKIKAQWGDCLDKASDAVMVAMEAQWKGTMLAAKGRVEFKETIKNMLIDSVTE